MDDKEAAIRARRKQITPGRWDAYINGVTVAIFRDGDPHNDIIGWPGFDGLDLPLSEVKSNAQFIAHAPADIDHLLATCDSLRARNQREQDLIRYCRHQLHEEGLITDDEFAALVMEGSESARRLEDYDSLRAEVEPLQMLTKSYPIGAPGMCSAHSPKNPKCPTCYPDLWQLVGAHDSLRIELAAAKEEIEGLKLQADVSRVGQECVDMTLGQIITAARSDALDEVIEKMRAQAEKWRQQAERWQEQANREVNPVIRTLSCSDRDACINKMAALLTFAIDLTAMKGK